jgi:hypothetical protein
VHPAGDDASGRSGVHDARLAARRLREFVPHADVEVRPGLTHGFAFGPGELGHFAARVLAFTGRRASTVDGSEPTKSG